MSDAWKLFPPFGDPWPSCLLPSHHEERKAEISPCSRTTMVLHPTTGFVNSAPTEHLDGNEALAVKTSLALATVDFVGMHMRRLGQVTV